MEVCGGFKGEEGRGWRERGEVEGVKEYMYARETWVKRGAEEEK